MGKCAEGIALVEEYAAKGSALAVSDAGCAAALDAQADALLSEYVPKADAVFAQVTKQLRT